jgi:hypothetical protein
MCIIIKNTVLMGNKKEIYIKIHYFHVPTGPPGTRNFTQIEKMFTKSSIQYQKGLNFLIEDTR